MPIEGIFSSTSDTQPSWRLRRVADLLGPGRHAGEPLLLPKKVLRAALDLRLMLPCRLHGVAQHDRHAARHIIGLAVLVGAIVDQYPTAIRRQINQHILAWLDEITLLARLLQKLL